MINYIMGELRGYAALRDPRTGIEPGPYERIWKSDKLISPSLRAELLAAAVAPLESVPEAAKDWHPGSDGKVLDLVHPSLYPVVYGRSLDRTSGQPIRPRSSDVESMFRSERFQWLPSEFQVQNDGTVRLVSPYINNIHPENHGVLVDVIQRVLENAVPMFEWVLSDLGRERQLPTRLDLKGEKFPQCIWPDACGPYPEGEDSNRCLVEHERLQTEDRERYYAERERYLDAAFNAWTAKGGTEDDFEEPAYPELQ
ncbi:hypothetical protein C8Q72DRAFT_265339 [Fomitopsis betulina]|nr:hypothetical protein C8Q72DRAFT_265339 [Fomitopsis betulina]